MDIYRVRKAKKSLKWAVRELAELRYKANGLASPDLSGMPMCSGAVADGGRTAKMAVEIADMEIIVQDRQLEYIQARKEMELFIETIPDALPRLIFDMHCVNGMSWREIYREIGAVEYHIDGRKTRYELRSMDGLKKMFYRYCEKYGIDYSMQSVIPEP